MTFPGVSSVIQIGPVHVHWYGLLVVAGVAAGYTVVKSLSRRSVGADRDLPQHFDRLFFHLIIWGFVGARLYHVLNEPISYWNHPLEIVKVWHGGLAIHGALLAGLIVVFIFVRYLLKQGNRVAQSYQVSGEQHSSVHDSLSMIRDTKSSGFLKIFFNLTDLLVVGLVLGQAIGRWGNYFNQELFGKPTDGFFKVLIDEAHRPGGFENVASYHPTFLYESVLNIILFFILFFSYRKATPPVPPLQFRGGEGELWPSNVGRVTSLYFIGYGLIRFFIDFLRIDHRPFFGGLYLSQWVSLAMIVSGAVVWYTMRESKSQKSLKNSW